MNAPVIIPTRLPAEDKGYSDAMRGITACPYGDEPNAALWARGYDYAFDNGLCRLPRFGRLVKGRRRR